MSNETQRTPPLTVVKCIKQNAGLPGKLFRVTSVQDGAADLNIATVSKEILQQLEYVRTRWESSMRETAGEKVSGVTCAYIHN